MLTSRRLLPFKQGAALSFEDTRQYSVEMIVEPDSPIAGRSIEDAGLRHLPGLYLAEIVRGDRVIGRVSPLVHLQANDRLVFVGNVDTVVELKKVTGLVSAENQVFKLDHGGERSLVEVVIGPDFPLLGKSVRDGNFRKYYGAVIIAVCRDGKQIKQRIGDIELKPGDTVLLETNSEFVRKQRFSRDFLVVSPVADFQPARSSKRWIAIGIMLVMVLSAATGLLSMFKAAMVAGGLMIITRCCTMDGARRSISWQVLAAIAASLGIGKAMEESGLAALIADFLVASAAGSELATMLVLFFVTAVFSALITNAAAAVLMFPIAVAASNDLGVSVIPYAVTLMVAASASFSTPIGYQTNMMVWGPGEYRFIDFLRLGIPLTVLVGAVTMFVVPLIWPFQV
jgi:di/tricarboxylate transporter